MSRRIKPVNLKPDEAKELLRAKQGFGDPPGSEAWMAMERARAKVAKAMNGSKPDGQSP